MTYALVYVVVTFDLLVQLKKQVMKVKVKIALFIALLCAMSVNAQSPDKRWGLGVNGGLEQYNGDFGGGFYNVNQNPYGFFGISVARNLTEHFDVEMTSTYGKVGYYENSVNRFSDHMFQLNMNAKLNFFKYDDVKLRPFVFAGLGYLYFKDKEIDNMQLPDFGAGVTYKVSSVVSLVLKETFMYTDYDRIENETGGINDMYLQHSIGLVFNLGSSKDSDGDGVSDKKDACPTVAGLEEFKGCPDTDRDGVADADDMCPKEVGLVAFKGCPDTDGDGVSDRKDACPTNAGLEALNGCPDFDGDGVADAKDHCPKVAGLVDFKGCPDTDGDGVEDSKDACPRENGTANGCPDSDGDGVANKFDACPNTAGIHANKGCPAVKAEVTSVLEQALHGVKFQSGKDVLTNSSYGILKNVVSIMQNNPAYKLEINGHTDS